MSVETKKLWVYHSPPKFRESLDSWLSRLASGNCLNLRNFLDFASGNYTPVSSVAFPLTFQRLPEFLPGLLSEQTGVEIAQVLETETFTSLTKAKRESKSLSRYLIYKDELAKGISKAGQFITQVCPLCLKTDPTPYLT